MALNEDQIEAIVRETLREMGLHDGGFFSPREPTPAAASAGEWLCDTADRAVQNAKDSQRRLMALSLAERGRLIDAMRAAAREHAVRLAELAHGETGYGNVRDKTLKNNLAIEKTPGIEDLRTAAQSGDDGLTIVEAAPYGVIGSITPSTNPTSTVINNAISMVAAGNAVVFNPHPAAKRCSQEAMRVLNEAIAAAGGPPALLATVKEPTLDSGRAVMEHKDVRILSVTGGEAVVNVAMKIGKKVIAAGPGNPPVIVDATADVKQAAKDIVDGASFDNNVLCVAEKEVFACHTVVDELMDQMEQNGAYRVHGHEVAKIMEAVLAEKDGGYLPKREFVGRGAAYILEKSGVSYRGNPRLVICEVEKEHPFVMTELLMPVLAVSRVRSFEEAVEASVKAEAGRLHSAYIHSTNIHNMSRAAAALNTTIFVKNAPSYAGLGFGGEGHTTLTIATPTGEGLTSARTFTRARRCVLKGDFRII